MTAVRPEDKPKLFAVMGACAVVMTLMVVQVKNAISPPRPAVKKEKVIDLTGEVASEIPSNGASGSMVASNGGAAAQPTVQIATTIAAPSSTDPFREVLPDEDGRSRPNPTPTQRPGAISGSIGQLPGATPGVGGPMVAPMLEARAFTPGADESLGQDDLQLKGILTGGSPVAVFSKGGRDMIVRPGESFGKGLSLLGVNNAGAYVRFDKKVLELELGQAITVAQPEIAPAPGPVGPGQMPPLLLNGIG